MRFQVTNPMPDALPAQQPVRAKENSPPFQRWVQSRSLSSPVRDGRKRDLCMGTRFCGPMRRGGVVLINTLLQRGVSQDVEPANRFNGLLRARKAAEAVGRVSACANSQLKQGVNEKAQLARRFDNGVAERGNGRAPLSSLRDSAGLGGNPALKRWAIVGRPDGLNVTLCARTGALARERWVKR